MYMASIPPGSGPCHHSCLSQKVYHQFAQDGPSNSESTESDDKNNVTRPLLYSLRVRFKVTQPCAASSSLQASCPNTPTPWASTSSTLTALVPIILTSQQPCSLQYVAYLPSQIWNSNWVASPGPWSGQLTYPTRPRG